MSYQRLGGAANFSALSGIRAPQPEGHVERLELVVPRSGLRRRFQLRSGRKLSDCIPYSQFILERSAKGSLHVWLTHGSIAMHSSDFGVADTWVGGTSGLSEIAGPNVLADKAALLDGEGAIGCGIQVWI